MQYESKHKRLVRVSVARSAPGWRLAVALDDEALRRLLKVDWSRCSDIVEGELEPREVLAEPIGVVRCAPGAYKATDDVMAAQADLVEIVHTLKQVVCVKG
jgi:hypothetical protein